MFSTGSGISILGPQLLVLFGDRVALLEYECHWGWALTRALPNCFLFLYVDGEVICGLPTAAPCCHASLPL